MNAMGGNEMKKKYEYFVILRKETQKFLNNELVTLEKDEDNGYNVEFPDFEDLFTCGDNLEDAMDMAKDLLEHHILELEDNNEVVPKPTNYIELVKYINESTLVMPLIIDTKELRFRESFKSVNKTVTLPAYIVEAGKQNKLNFSAILQSALRNELGEKLREPIKN